MIEKRLAEQLRRVGRRVQWLRLSITLAVVWLAATLAAIGLLAARWNALVIPDWAVPTLAVTGLLVGWVGVWRMLFSRPDAITAARQIEAAYPELDAKLLAAVEQKREVGSVRLGYLQTMVIGEALAHGHRTRWTRVAPPLRTFTAFLGQFLLMGLFVALCVLLLHSHHYWPAASVTQSTVSLPVGPQYDAMIEPGDVELERGTSLLVLARFAGELPSEVSLAYQPAAGEAQTLAMSKSFDDPVFAGRVANVETDLSYTVEFAGQRSKAYRVTVFDFPELERADVKLAFPAYTGQSETVVEDTFDVTAVEGTRLTLIARLNKDVAKAELVGDGPTIALAADAEGKHVYNGSLTLEKTVRYKLHLVDAAGRKNKEPPEFTFTAVPNRRPEIKLVFPSRDVQVSPLEELETQASVWDDFGLLSYGVVYSLDGRPPKEITLGEKAPGKEKCDARQLLSFEELKAEPDQLLSYYYFADDVGADGKSRRTSSDMFFCEVRHFEEIFRQGEQPPGGSSQRGAGQEVDKVADLQKQVITATWKVIRRETGTEPTPDFAKDAGVLLEGEQEVLSLADELEEKLKTPESKAFLEAARKQMRRAIEQLQSAVDSTAVGPLQPALAAEQAAYQALLKLRAREHNIMRGSPSKGGQAGSRSSAQLSQLELKNNDNRYEQQRTAEQQETAVQRETRQVLNRLRELAQRQADLNERIKEMQSALAEAQTEQEKEEIRKQLKRLRDEEQQILRDADELRNRMDQPENQQRMSEAKQQLDQTRNNVRQASEALQEGKASQAAAAGTRAEQQLQQLRDQFRKQAAGRFNDEVRQMREDARELDKNEQELSQKLAESNAPKNKSLREPSGREELQSGFEKQQADLEKLLEEMKQTVQEAETSEPLLSKQLYDTIRQAHQQRTGAALDMTKQLLERGFVAESRQAEEQAKAGITKLKQGVEKAAESVLGDEAEAIRRARDAVDQLAKAVDDEMRRATGKGASNDQPQPEPSSEKNGEGQKPTEPQSPKEGQPKPNAEGNGQPKDGDKPGEQGGKPGEQSGKPSEQGGKPGESDKPNAGDQPGKSQQSVGQQPGGQQPNAQQPGRSQAGDQQANDNPQRGGRNDGNPNGRGGVREFLEAAGGFTGPLTGGDFRPWSDRLRDVEEMIDDPQLRAEAAKIRDRAAAMRAEFKRHSKEPNWELVREKVYEPLAELRQRLSEELLKLESHDALVPLDRDLVPPKYLDDVRRYYERLGSGK
jgi:hypothetical protein